MTSFPPLDDLGRRIMVLGPTNAGKSTLTEALAKRLHAPAIHLDLYRHLPDTNWVQRPDDEFAALHDAAIDQPDWIMDGSWTPAKTGLRGRQFRDGRLRSDFGASGSVRLPAVPDKGISQYSGQTHAATDALFVEDQAVEVVGQIGQRQFGLARVMPMVRMNRPKRFF